MRDRPEISGSHHQINMVQHSSWLPRPSSTDERASGYRVVSSTENTTRNGIGWKLRPVSELRASAGVYLPFHINVYSS